MNCKGKPHGLRASFCSIGSQQEFDGVSISRGFPESDKFGLGYGHALSFEK